MPTLTAPAEYPTYDARDDGEHQHLQFKTIGEIMHLHWNAWKSRAITKSRWDEGEHDAAVAKLLHGAKARNEKVLGVLISNFGVNIAVAA